MQIPVSPFTYVIYHFNIVLVMNITKKLLFSVLIKKNIYKNIVVYRLKKWENVVNV